jgi:aminoglycoside phosphotransferase (APT) family kinase protein
LIPSIDADLVARLIANQFPHWAELPVVPVLPQGWDNRTFRVGSELSARLPSAEGYALQVVKEQRWLPHLAAHLALPIPEPVALGLPALGYPFAWSVSRWLDGVVLSRAHGINQAQLAEELAAFLVALRQVPAADGPPPGPVTAYRGTPLTHYADEALSAFRSLHPVTAALAEEVFHAAVTTRWKREPVWFHGDFAADNVLIRHGRLHAVLDFGCAGVGDPACDLVIAFTWLDHAGRQVFRRAVGLDDETWLRGRGWALWKAAITLLDSAAPRLRKQEQRRALTVVLDDFATRC